MAPCPVFGLEPGDPALQPVDLVLEGEDPLDALEVDALVGQPLHLAQDLDVAARSTAAAAAASGRARRGRAGRTGAASAHAGR